MFLHFRTFMRMDFHVISCSLFGASGTRGFRRGVRPAQMRSSGWGVMRGWMIVWLVHWWTGLDDGLPLIFEEYFWSDWGFFDELTDLITSCLWCSLLFICSVPTLPVLSPATSFAEISPEVILDYGIKTGILLFDIKQSFYYKTAWMRFCNHIHTVWGLKKIFQFFEYLVCTHAACK